MKVVVIAVVLLQAALHCRSEQSNKIDNQTSNDNDSYKTSRRSFKLAQIIPILESMDSPDAKLSKIKKLIPVYDDIPDYRDKHVIMPFKKNGKPLAYILKKTYINPMDPDISEIIYSDSVESNEKEINSRIKKLNEPGELDKRGNIKDRVKKHKKKISVQGNVPDTPRYKDLNQSQFIIMTETEEDETTDKLNHKLLQSILTPKKRKYKRLRTNIPKNNRNLSINHAKVNNKHNESLEKMRLFPNDVNIEDSPLSKMIHDKYKKRKDIPNKYLYTKLNHENDSIQPRVMMSTEASTIITVSDSQDVSKLKIPGVVASRSYPDNIISPINALITGSSESDSNSADPIITYDVSDSEIIDFLDSDSQYIETESFEDSDNSKSVDEYKSNDGSDSMSESGIELNSNYSGIESESSNISDSQISSSSNTVSTVIDRLTGLSEPSSEHMSSTESNYLIDSDNIDSELSSSYDSYDPISDVSSHSNESGMSSLSELIDILIANDSNSENIFESNETTSKSLQILDSSDSIAFNTLSTSESSDTKLDSTEKLRSIEYSLLNVDAMALSSDSGSYLQSGTSLESTSSDDYSALESLSDLTSSSTTDDTDESTDSTPNLKNVASNLKTSAKNLKNIASDLESSESKMKIPDLGYITSNLNSIVKKLELSVMDLDLLASDSETDRFGSLPDFRKSLTSTETNINYITDDSVLSTIGTAEFYPIIVESTPVLEARIVSQSLENPKTLIQQTKSNKNEDKVNGLINRLGRGDKTYSMSFVFNK